MNYKEVGEASFNNLLSQKEIELIEVKRKLNRLVIGQIIVGIDMFKKQYGSINIKGVILCTESDPALEEICRERNIIVKVI